MDFCPHLTVAAVVERAGRFLIVEEMAHGERVFNQPAGHVDEHESLIEAAVRETREETAWLFTPEFLLGVYLWRHPEQQETYLRVTYGGSVADYDAEQALDDGIIASHWLAPDSPLLQQHSRSPLVSRCIEDYLAGKRLPLDCTPDVLSLK